LIQSVPIADSRIRGEASMADTPASPVSTSATPTSSRAEIDAGLRQFLLSVYNYMASGLALTGGVAYVAAESGLYASLAKTPILLWVVVLSPLALVLFLSFRIEKMSLGAAQAAFWAYAGLIGLSLAGIFLVYTGASIARTFFITAATFLAMSVYGYTTRTDLTALGSFLMMGLVGIIIASVVNMFLVSSALQLAISLIGVIVFVGLTAYDTQRIKNIYLESDGAVIAGKKAIMGALALYLDFLNLFVMLLQLSGARRS
jgi:FtsH-binding integral membrane protein